MSFINSKDVEHWKLKNYMQGGSSVKRHRTKNKDSRFLGIFKSKKNNPETKKSINPIFIYPFLVIASLIIGCLIQYMIYRPDFGTFLSSDMDISGNVYVLSVNPENNRYRITKVDSSSHTKFQIDLDKSTSKVENTYRYIESDTKGNIYIVKEQRDKEAVQATNSLYPIINESVLMYDTNGNYVKQVATVDFSEEANPPTVPYIKKLQVVDQKVTIVGAKDNNYDIIMANPLKDESPTKLKTFEIKPSVEQSNKNVEWVNDIAVLSNGRVAYSTKNGKFYAMDNQNAFLDYTDVVSRGDISLTGFHVDSSDNLYFTDMMSGNFYKLSTRSTSPTILYKLESEIIPGKDIKIKDLRTVKVISEDYYYAISKDFTNPYHVKFGGSTLLLDNITGAFLPWGLIITIFIAVCIIGLYFLIRALLRWNIKRIPLAIRLTGMFLPVFLISMGVLLFMVSNDASSEYISVLKNDQDTGARIASDHINGDSFSSINHTSDYMTSTYINVKNQLQEAYADIASKIGDKSDYIVTYIVKSDKIYSTFNSKFSTSSSSYNYLKYTDPDMIMSGSSLVDYNLERDEVETLYNVWNSFNSKTENSDIIRATLRDVYGDISVSFAPIRNSGGKTVGFIGNFMDENVHKNNEIQKIFAHSSSIVLIIAFIIFVYMCFVVKFSLRPIKSLEKGINDMSKGIWKTRVRVTSKDEFADIAETFNLLSEKIDTYTSNLILLNEKYIKFVPSEIFKLIGKDKITQVDLHDYKTMKMNVVYVTFNISCKDAFNFESEKELFDILNTSYEKFFDIVQKNNGVVQAFSGLSATILFPNNSQDAFNASVQFKEASISDKIRSTMNITLGAGKMLIGVSGNENRRGVLVVSDELMQLFNIDSHLNSLNINHVATKSVIEALPTNGVCNYRFIGKVGNINGTGSVEVYEMIDMTNQYKKDLYLGTKDIFEKAVRVYMDKDFEQARKLFSDVLRVNNRDSVAIHYLMKCDNHINNSNDNFDKRKWTGNIF